MKGVSGPFGPHAAWEDLDNLSFPSAKEGDTLSAAKALAINIIEERLTQIKSDQVLSETHVISYLREAMALAIAGNNFGASSALHDALFDIVSVPKP